MKINDDRISIFKMIYDELNKILREGNYRSKTFIETYFPFDNILVDNFDKYEN